MATLKRDNIKQIKNLLREANTFEDKGLINEARRKYEQCILYDDGTIPETEDERKWREPLFHSWLRYSSLLRDQREWLKALEAAKRANNLKISDFTYYNMGKCYQEIGEPIKAEKAFQQAIKIKPRAEYWVLLYQLLFNHFKDRTEEAIQCLYSALELEPDYEEALYFLGIYLRVEGNYVGAEEKLRKAIKIDPQYGRAYAELSWVEYLDHSNQKNLDKEFFNKIEKKLMKSIKLDPSYGGSRLYLAFIFEKQKKIKKANEQYKELLKIWPDHSISHWAYGDFLTCRGGNQKQAEYYLREAVEIDSEDSAAYYFLGKALMRWKRYSEANKFLIEAANRGDKLAEEIISEFQEYVSGSLNFDSFNEKMSKKYRLL